MTEQDFEAILGRGYEINGVEFKGPGARTDRPFFAKVARAVLSMANRRDGGLVIIGVENETMKPVGLNDDDLATWASFDNLSVALNQYADPSVSFDLEVPFAYDSKRFVILRVREFDEVPILCRKDFNGPGKVPPILREGACYVRSRRKSETAEIPSQEEMRELLDLAIDKGVRRFIARAQKTGLFPVSPADLGAPSDEQRFRKQIEDMG